MAATSLVAVWKHIPYNEGMSMIYPNNLTDEQWAILEPHIPPCKHGGRR